MCYFTLVYFRILEAPIEVVVKSFPFKIGKVGLLLY